MPNPQTSNTDVEMIWDKDDEGQVIELVVPRTGGGMIKGYAIPTSFFRQPGNDVFA